MITVVDLGSLGGLKLSGIEKEVHYIGLDVANAENPYTYAEIDLVEKVVAPSAGIWLWHGRPYAGCSGLVVVNEPVIRDFGVEPYFLPEVTSMVEAVTLQSVLTALDVPKVDYLKVDLEGLDYEMLSANAKLVSECLLVRVEAWFIRLFQSPGYADIAALMASWDFSVLDLRPEWWKFYADGKKYSRGVIAFADVVFIRTPKDSVEYEKQARILSAMGYDSLEKHMTGKTIQRPERTWRGEFPHVEKEAELGVNPDDECCPHCHGMTRHEKDCPILQKANT